MAERCCRAPQAPLDVGARLEQLAQEACVDEINRQPDFEEEDVVVATPFKGHKAPHSGTTPLGENSFHHRVHLVLNGGPNFNLQEGVPGWRQESPIKLFK